MLICATTKVTQFSLRPSILDLEGEAHASLVIMHKRTQLHCKSKENRK